MKYLILLVLLLSGCATTPMSSEEAARWRAVGGTLSQWGADIERQRDAGSPKICNWYSNGAGGWIQICN
jgi:hypothetical protein